MKTGLKRGLALATVLMLAACARAPLGTAPLEERAMIQENLLADISILASDEYGGRKPGTEGEIKTVAFIVDQLEAAGFSPGTNDPGSPWRAPVQLLSARPMGGTVAFLREEGTVELTDDEFAAFTTVRRNLIVDAELAFVGFEAEDLTPEEVKGRVVVMLGEPGQSAQRREILRTKQAAAIITVVDDPSLIETLRGRYGRDTLSLASEDQDVLSVFVSDEAMVRALGDAEWSTWVQSASEENFAASLMPLKINMEARAERREFASSNVIGRLPGTDPTAGAVLMLGHWDHLGECGSEGDEDRICNGAVDNASGIAMMLELARRLAWEGPHPRDIYFLATTAEESGLLGARAFAEVPPVPLDNFVAAFNFDTVALAPTGAPIVVIGEGRTDLDPIVFDIIGKAKRKVGDQALAETFVRRQDGWALLDAGVPAIMLSSSLGSRELATNYLNGAYHSASDEVEGIELGGAIDDLLLHQELIRRFADPNVFMPSGEN